MTAEISILGLILEASLLVKMVMLILMGMSVVSWAMIIKEVKCYLKLLSKQKYLKTNFGLALILLNCTKRAINAR